MVQSRTVPPERRRVARGGIPRGYVPKGAAGSEGGEGVGVGIYGIKPAFQRSLGGIEGWLVARRVHPDALTYTALVISLAGGLALYLAPAAPWLLLTIPVVALGRTALNALDGLVAARTGLARPWGEVLNELCDRFADVALFDGLALPPTTNIYLGAVTLVAILLSSYVGILSRAAGGPRQYRGPMGKADRMIYLSIATVVGFALGPAVLNYFLGLVLLGVVVTLIARGAATYGALRVVR